MVSKPQDPAVSTHSALVLQMHAIIPGFFYVGSGNGTRVLMLILHMLYRQNHLPNPSVLSQFGIHDVESKEHHDFLEESIMVEAEWKVKTLITLIAIIHHIFKK